MEWKFYPRDVIRGKADKPGDHFYAMVNGRATALSRHHPRWDVVHGGAGMTPALKASYQRMLARPYGLALAKIAKASAAYGTNGNKRNHAALAKVSCIETLGIISVELVQHGLAEYLHGYLTLTEDGLDIGVKLWSFAEREGMEV